MCPAPQLFRPALLRTSARSSAANLPGRGAAASARGEEERRESFSFLSFSFFSFLFLFLKLRFRAPGRGKPATGALLLARSSGGGGGASETNPAKHEGAQQAAVFSRLGASDRTPSSDTPRVPFPGYFFLQDSSLCPTSAERSRSLLHRLAGENEQRAGSFWGPNVRLRPASSRSERAEVRDLPPYRTASLAIPSNTPVSSDLQTPWPPILFAGASPKGLKQTQRRQFPTLFPTKETHARVLHAKATQSLTGNLKSS